MKMPFASATAITSSPCRAAISRPLMVRVTVSLSSATGGLHGSVGGAAQRDRRVERPAHIGLELVAEPADRGRDGRNGRRAERADGGLAGRPVDTGADVVADVEEQVDVLRATLPRDDAGEDLLEPRGALTARRALAARLLREEAHDAVAGAHDVGVFVHHPDRARTEHGSCLAHGAGLERQVEVLLEEPRRRRAAGDERLEALAVADAAAIDRRLDQVAEGRDAELDLVDAGLVDVTGHGEHAHALAGLGAERGE